MAKGNNIKKWKEDEEKEKKNERGENGQKEETKSEEKWNSERKNSILLKKN